MAVVLRYLQTIIDPSVGPDRDLPSADVHGAADVSGTPRDCRLEPDSLVLRLVRRRRRDDDDDDERSILLLVCFGFSLAEAGHAALVRLHDALDRDLDLRQPGDPRRSDDEKVLLDLLVACAHGDLARARRVADALAGPAGATDLARAAMALATVLEAAEVCLTRRTEPQSSRHTPVARDEARNDDLSQAR